LNNSSNKYENTILSTLGDRRQEETKSSSRLETLEDNRIRPKKPYQSLSISSFPFTLDSPKTSNNNTTRNFFSPGKDQNIKSRDLFNYELPEPKKNNFSKFSSNNKVIKEIAHFS
jgi:hypothetical protein